jgi:hypothetical protein
MPPPLWLATTMRRATSGTRPTFELPHDLVARLWPAYATRLAARGLTALWIGPDRSGPRWRVPGLDESTTPAAATNPGLVIRLRRLRRLTLRRPAPGLWRLTGAPRGDEPALAGPRRSPSTTFTTTTSTTRARASAGGRRASTSRVARSLGSRAR